ncbi:HAD-IC family P-type ATPase [Chitinophaga oryziterrae]|uniref:HAD-IC family P-type ATPase n=1 Tax=Chitinophaga oryziterrae TaxID=1031224 RepID=A0A6N8JCT6_9BACT|nr:cation-translocating P-type ATPase [Chitinophaga oryziterrae]MVT43023.1 HAD-IC family P-type ATPase [Chitinophaga oryziterrae]
MIVNKVATGLGPKQVLELRERYGKNIFQEKHTGKFSVIILGVIREPMFLLLVAACLIYFILGDIAEGITMLSAMLLVSAISVYQETKSSRALEALKLYTAPKAIVIRNAREEIIDTEDLVPGDILLLAEGDLIPADAEIITANDLTVNESVMTGEAMPVAKDTGLLYQGTSINTGKCVSRVTATGNNTALGKLGKAISTNETTRTRLQVQMGHTVTRLTIFGISAFIIICVLNFIKSRDITGSILLGLTLAMAAIPEEIPVAFSSFMALGAYYMAGKGIISRHPQTIENLGGVSTICLDKTGTITENRMEVVMIYDHLSGELTDKGSVLHYAALASEKHPFDSMEKAILEAFNAQDSSGSTLPAMVHEYPLEGRPPMMTHVYAAGTGFTAAAKGAPERIMGVCKLDKVTIEKVNTHIQTMASKGYRVLGVASAMHEGPFPENQDNFNWHFEGLLSLYDPPKANAANTIGQLYAAGIAVKLITGDYPETAINIAEKTGFNNYQRYTTGEEIMGMTDEALHKAVGDISIFARMFPEAKLRVVEALKINGETVAMTGDGVNDGLALKAADIGIAMGKKGTEIARLASDLVIIDDNLEKIPESIMQGRKIYNNLKKAIRYIISIHIPIILTATIPPLLGWKYPNIFSPVHIIFLELIMGPTCSLFYEKEPVEYNLMRLPPRKTSRSLFNSNEMIISIVQGLIIAAGVLTLYNISMGYYSLEETRTLVFTSLLFSNIFLTFTNRSFTENITKTMKYHNPLAPVIIAVSLVFIAIILFVPPVRTLFGLATISPFLFFLCLVTGFATVAWFEVYKTNLPGPG